MGAGLTERRFALAAFFNDETITPRTVLFAAAVVATVAISTRTRGGVTPMEPVIPGWSKGPDPDSRDSQMRNRAS